MKDENAKPAGTLHNAPNDDEVGIKRTAVRRNVSNAEIAKVNKSERRKNKKQNERKAEKES